MFRGFGDSGDDGGSTGSLMQAGGASTGLSY